MSECPNPAGARLPEVGHAGMVQPCARELDEGWSPAIPLLGVVTVLYTFCLWQSVALTGVADAVQLAHSHTRTHSQVESIPLCMRQRKCWTTCVVAAGDRLGL